MDVKCTFYDIDGDIVDQVSCKGSTRHLHMSVDQGGNWHHVAKMVTEGED